MRFVDITKEEYLSEIAGAFGKENIARARLLVELEIQRGWEEHQKELEARYPMFYKSGDDGTEPQIDGSTAYMAINAVHHAHLVNGELRLVGGRLTSNKHL